MPATYVNIPLVGEFFIETDSITYGRTYIDAALHKGAAEIWIGRLHIVADKPKMNPLPVIITAIITAAVMASDRVEAARSWFFIPTPGI